MCNKDKQANKDHKKPNLTECSQNTWCSNEPKVQLQPAYTGPGGHPQAAGLRPQPVTSRASKK